MPHSLRDNDEAVLAYVQAHGIKSMLDIGAGSGTYGRLLADLVPTRHAVEVWAEYLEEFALREVYDFILINDVRHLAALPDNDAMVYDLIIFGDVLEHMTAAEGLRVWAWAKRVARHGLISVPIVHWPQGEIDGNPYEAHVQDHLTADDYIEAYGPFDETYIFAETATFITEFR